MSDLRPQVRAAIQNFLTHHQDHHTAVDVLRVIQEEATLMKETEDVRDALSSDPYEALKSSIPAKNLERFQQALRVTMCDRVRMGTSVARTHVIVAWPTKDNMELSFLYERRPRKGMLPGTAGSGCQVSYTIELSYNHGQRQRLLEVMVWAASDVPSHEPAVCIQNEMDNEEEEEEDEWEDLDDNEGEQEEAETDVAPTKDTIGTTATTSISSSSSSPDVVPANKKQKTDLQQDDGTTSNENNPNGDMVAKDSSFRDEYVAFLDPDVLQSFLESAGLLSEKLDDATAFFLLMTFPFFEHEWDIVGFVLDQFFGEGDDESDDENGKHSTSK